MIESYLGFVKMKIKLLFASMQVYIKPTSLIKIFFKKAIPNKKIGRKI